MLGSPTYRAKIQLLNSTPSPWALLLKGPTCTCGAAGLCSFISARSRDSLLVRDPSQAPSPGPRPGGAVLPVSKWPEPPLTRVSGLPATAAKPEASALHFLKRRESLSSSVLNERVTLGLLHVPITAKCHRLPPPLSCIISYPLLPSLVLR